MSFWSRIIREVVIASFLWNFSSSTHAWIIDVLERSYLVQPSTFRAHMLGLLMYLRDHIWFSRPLVRLLTYLRAGIWFDHQLIYAELDMLLASCFFNRLQVGWQWRVVIRALPRVVVMAGEVPCLFDLCLAAGCGYMLFLSCSKDS